MINDLFSHIQDLAAFQRPATDSLALQSMLELCFEGVPGDPTVVGPGRRRLPATVRPSMDPHKEEPNLYDFRLHPGVDPWMD